MAAFEFIRAIAGVIFLILPGFLLTYLIFRDKETLLERLVIGLSLSISITTLVLFGANKLFDLDINALTCTIIISVITLIIVLALLKSNTIHLKSVLNSFTNQSNKLKQYSILTIILALAFFMAFIAHLHYIYPLHIDEWFHLGWCQALVKTQTIAFVEPFYGEMMIYNHPEIGFHLFLCLVKLITGLPWTTIFLYTPGLIFMLTVLVVFYIGQRIGSGLLAAFFVALIPRTTRMLGPSILVPLNLGLFFFAIILFLLYCCEFNRKIALVSFITLTFLHLTHPPTAIAASVLCVLFGILFSYKIHKHEKEIRNWQQFVLILLSVFLSAPVSILRNTNITVEMIKQIPQPETYLLPIYDALIKFGFIPLTLYVVGIGFLVYKGDRKAWELAISSWIFLVIILCYQWLNLGIPILYERGFFYFFLLAGIIIGATIKDIQFLFSHCFSKITNDTKRGSVLASFIIFVLILFAVYVVSESGTIKPLKRLDTLKVMPLLPGGSIIVPSFL
jgi:hypothetical protein